MEIPPHPEDYAVLLTVLEGKGEFSGADRKFTLTENQSIYMKKGEVRRIKAINDLVVLGIKDKPKS